MWRDCQAKTAKPFASARSRTSPIQTEARIRMNRRTKREPEKRVRLPPSPFDKQKTPLNRKAENLKCGVPGGSRTLGPQFRKLMLYPAELRGRNISLLPRFFAKEKQKSLSSRLKQKKKAEENFRLCLIKSC